MLLSLKMHVMFLEEILAEKCPHLIGVAIPNFFEVVKPRFLQHTYTETHKETSPLGGRKQGIMKSDKLRKMF